MSWLFAGDLRTDVPWTTVNEGFNQYTGLMLDHLNVVQRGTEENAAECPFCGGRSSLQFNDVKGVWICFKCGESGTAKKLVQLLNGTYAEPEIDLANLSKELRELQEQSYEPARFLPESILLRYSNRTSAPHRLWQARGFDKKVCDRWELGFDPLADRGGALTLPYRSPDTRHLDGIIFRAVEPGDGPRYKFPKGFAKAKSLYGSWIPASYPGTITLVEGPTDAIRVDQALHRAMAQYGSSISAGQIRLLHRLGTRRLVLFYDYDRAGLRATEKGEHLADEFEVRRVRWNRKKYCWHGTVCGCPFGFKEKDIWIAHTSTGNCPSMRACKCGRIHEPDPCSLELKEIQNMVKRAVEV